MGTRKNGKVVYKVSKKANLNKKLEIDESKIKNSKKRTEALTKEYSSGRTPAKKTPTKKTTPKKTSYIKTGITGGAAQAAKEYRKKNPAKNTKKKETKKKETKKKSNQLTSNEALLLQNLTRTGSKKVVEQGKKNAAKALTTSKAKTDEYKNLNKKTSKKKSKQGTRLTSNESLLVQNLARTGTPNVVNKGLKGAEKTLRTSKAKTDEYKNLNKKVAKQDEKFLNSSPFAYGVMAGSSPIPLKQTIERQTGQKINTSKAEKTAGYKAGYMAGLMGEYIATGGIARGAVEQGIKAGAKQLAKSTGKKTAINVVKKGQKLPKAVKKISTSIAADTITGIPTNTLEAGKEASEAAKGEKGKTFAKSLALNTALDVGFGGAMEALPAAAKAVAKKSKIKKAGQTGNAKSPSRYAQNASETTALKATRQVASAETNPLPTSKTGLDITANDSLPKAGAGAKAGELSDARKFMSPETQEKVFEAVSKRSGAKIEYADLPEGVDGVYKNGVIKISNKAQNPAYTVMKHELTHHIETSGNYKAFADFVENNMREQGVDVDGMIESIISDYKAAGKNLTNEEARKEFTAKFTEECLFNSEKSIERLARENPSLFRQVYEWIVDTINKIGASSETRFLIDAQRKYEKALRTATSSADDVEKYLFVGAEKNKITIAEKMEADGASPEEIKKKLNMHRGADGKWRFETDDSKASFYPNGDARFAGDAEYQRYRELTDKAEKNMLGLSNEGLTVAEETERKALAERFASLPKGSTLADYMTHSELYDKYPNLKEMKLYRIANIPEETKGAFSPEDKRIVVNSRLKGDDFGRTVTHETQHAVQEIEDFARGANLETLSKNTDDIKYELKSKERAYNSIAGRIIEAMDNTGYFKKYGEDIDITNIAEQRRILQEHRGTPEEKTITQFLDRFSELQQEMGALRTKVRELNKTSPVEYYTNSAGEIEARQAEGRLNMEAAQRRETLPDASGNKNATDPNKKETSFHISKAFSDEIDKTLNGETHGKNQVKARDHTPTVLVKNGVEDLPMLITQKHIKSIVCTKDEAVRLGIKDNDVNYHGLGKKLLTKAIDGMDDPAAIYKQGDNNYLIITQIKDNTGNEIIVPVSVNGKGWYNDVHIDENHIQTVYGKKNLDRYLDKHSFEKIYEKKGDVSIHGVQFSGFNGSLDNSISKSLPKVNNMSKDSLGRKLSEDQRKYFDGVDLKLRDKDGNIKVYYHGTGRADRVGREFKSERATSGPMAFFTDDRQIATNYSKDKADTSLHYDSDYDNYYTQFRTTVKGKDSSVGALWNELSPSKRAEVTERAKHITWDDDLENIIFDPNQKRGNGSFDDYLLKEHKGNAIEALTESWLENGELFGRESDFLDILKKAGIDADVKYMNPDYREEAVYETYLNIKNAFDTSDVTQEFVNKLKRFAATADMSKYAQKGMYADIWDKNNVSIEEFIRRLEGDIKNGTSHAWTSVPDVVTDFLKSEGFDGIVDAGGKGGGAYHQVVIPFRSEQIKDVNNAHPTAKSGIDLSTGRSLGGDAYIDNLRKVSENLYGEKGNKYLPDARELKLVEEDGALPRVTRKVKGEAKAARYEKRKIRNFDKTVKEALGVSKYGDSEKIKRLTSEAAEKMKDDTLTAKDKDELFNAVFEEGINVDMSFLEKYKGLKDELRNKPLKITDSIKADIADYNDFRKGNMGTLRLSKEGRDIDVEYAELRGLYPELFPEKNTPAEMLEEISSVAKSIRATETKISKLYDNEEAKEYIKYSREQFDKALDDLDKEMHIVKRYLKRDNEDVREAMHSAYDVKKLKREADRVKQNVLLSDEDRGLVDMLHSGKLKPENVSNFSQNSKNILEVYEAEKAVKNAEEPLKAIGAETKAGYMETAEDVLSGSDSFRDKKMGFAYNRETAERNLVDIAGKEDGERIIREFFTPVHENEALATKFKNAMRKEIKSLGISTKETYSTKFKFSSITQLFERLTGGKKKMSEAALLQMYGEKKISKELLEEIGAPVEKIENAVKTIRRVYNDLITAANEELVRHGYEPIEYRKDYFPHFEETKPDGLLAKIAEKLGFDIQTDELPTDIAGLTHTFRPGKKWFAHALSRGAKSTTEYDAIKGFDIYLEGISDIIYHTEDIQKLRALEGAVRYKYSDKAVKDQIDELRTALKKGQIDSSKFQSEVNKIYDEQDNTKLSKFATWLRDYTDGLAGKKTQADRVLEHNIGRGIYNSTKALEGRLAANMVAVNPASWLTNFIPLVQGGSVKPSSIIKGMAETVQNKIRKDDFSDISAFLTNRKGSDALWKSRTEKIQDFLTKPMKWIDGFTSEAIVRAKYAEEIAKGTNPGEAVRIADRFAADVIADRSKGSLPVSFNSKNPISKIFTMFQVEVNNQWSHLMKDIPRNSENVALTALAFTNFFVASYIFNDVYEHFVGRRPALDPIGWANEFMGDVTGKEVPNLWDAVVAAAKGQGFSLEDVDKDIAGAGTNLAKNAVKDLPFAGGLMEGGRVPISSALPNAWDTISAAGGLASGEGSKKKYWSQLGKEALKPATYLLPPVGGGQAKKLYEAGMTLARQGDYGLDKEGEQQLKYAVDRNAGNVIKGTLFGKYTMGSGQQYIDNGFKMLSAKKTTAFKEAVNAGMKPSEAESFIKNLPEDTDAARSRIFNSDLTGAQKNAVGKAIQKGDKKINYSNESIYKYSLLDKQQKEKVDELTDKGFTRESAMEIRKAVKGCSGQMSQVMALASTGYDMPEVYNALGIKKGKNGNGPREKAEMLISNGLSIEAFNAVKEASDANGSGNVSIKEAMKYLDDSGYSRSECYALTFALTGCKHKNNPYR